MQQRIERRAIPWRVIAWGGAAGLILAPLVAMQFTHEVEWTASDFALAAAMVGGVGLAFELAVRLSNSVAYRAGVAFALLAALLLVWINLAVGIIGSEDDPANRMFAVVPAVALGGALIARWRPRGMRNAMFAAALAQGGVAITAAALGRGSILPITVPFGALWLIAAWLFTRAARAV